MLFEHLFCNIVAKLLKGMSGSKCGKESFLLSLAIRTGRAVSGEFVL